MDPSLMGMYNLTTEAHSRGEWRMGGEVEEEGKRGGGEEWKMGGGEEES